MKKETISTYKQIKQGLLVALLLASSAAIAMPAQAVQYRGTGGRPAYPRADNPRTESIFVHILEPGDVQEDGIRVINNDSEPKTLLVYAADSTPSSSGGFACKQLLDQQTGVGTWIELEKSEVTLEPGTNEVVDFTITVPENADVGEQNGCILVQEKPEDEPEEEQQAGMHLSFRTGLRVALTIPGELRRDLSLAGFTVEHRETQSGFLYKAQVENNGNISTDANVAIVTKNLFGKVIEEHGGEYTILRGDISELNFELEKPFWGGWYTAAVSLDYDSDPNTEIGTDSGNREILRAEPVRFFSAPHLNALLIELAVIGLVLIILILFIISRKRAAWIKKSWESYEVKQDDDINSLAAKYDVSWKVLAKANKLSAPYTLHMGQDIIVPPNDMVKESPKKKEEKTKEEKKEKPKPEKKKPTKKKDSTSSK